MDLSGYISEHDVHEAIAALQEPCRVFEVRVISNSGRKTILSGYFRDANTLLDAFTKIDVRGRNIYITLNAVKEECFSRSQSEHFEQNVSTTSDTEIERFRWLFVDLDPVRPAGISSSSAELKMAGDMAKKVAAYMSGLGFPEPVKAASGNGYHLLYRIDIANDEPGRAMVERCLKNLAAMFDTAAVKIDTTNSNPSRICKLHGTLAQKGTSTSERPHRMSGILKVPEPIVVASEEAVRRLAAELPAEPVRPGRRKIAAQDFDLERFLDDAGLTYETDSNDRAKIYRLDHCPFDHNHTDGDAKIFQYADGAIAFKCHHNSCRQYKWQDVRLKYEPDAYDHSEEDERIDAGWREHLSAQLTGADPPPAANKLRRKTPLRKLKTATELMAKNIPEPRVFVGVGCEVPLLVEGTCILSAKAKLGKSWFVLAMCMAVVRGEDFLGYKTQKCAALYLDLETSEALQQRRIRKVLRGDAPPDNFYLETETDGLDDGFVEQIESYMQQDPNIGVVIVDVFQYIRTKADSKQETEYDHVYRDIGALNKVANKYHIAIILVCHDRKVVDPDDPFSNILGSTGLQGAAQQMIVMFRRKKGDPIHVSVKGKAIDGWPELDVTFDNGQWAITDGKMSADQGHDMLMAEYVQSNIRRAALAIVEAKGSWKGRCSALINDAVEYGIGIEESAREVGGFLHRHQGRFMSQDKVAVRIIDNGTGPKIYEIINSPLMTIDTIDGEWQNAEESSIPWE